MKAKQLLILSAAFEAAIGLSLAIVPDIPVSILLGSSLNTSAGSLVARVAGAALLSLSVACWLARHDKQSRAANGVICAMLLYNTSAVGLMIYAAIGLKLIGPGLWPTILLHAAMAILCIACLRSTKLGI
jgi:hypothetical protein